MERVTGGSVNTSELSGRYKFWFKMLVDANCTRELQTGMRRVAFDLTQHLVLKLNLLVIPPRLGPLLPHFHRGPSVVILALTLPPSTFAWPLNLWWPLLLTASAKTKLSEMFKSDMVSTDIPVIYLAELKLGLSHHGKRASLRQIWQCFEYLLLTC